MGGGGGGGGGQGGCESRIEVFWKIQKKNIGGGGPGWGVRMDVNEELKFLLKSKKNLFFLGGGGGGGGSGGVGLGGQDGCERRIEVFVKIKKKSFFWGGGSRGGVGLGGQGGCERRIEVFVKIQKKKKIWGGGGGGGSVWGVRVDVNEELKFL